MSYILRDVTKDHFNFVLPNKGGVYAAPMTATLPENIVSTSWDAETQALSYGYLDESGELVTDSYTFTDAELAAAAENIQ